MNKDQATSLYHDLIQGAGYAAVVVPLVVTNNHTAQVISAVIGLGIWGFGTYLSLKFNLPPPPAPSLNSIPSKQ